jgi:CRP-like cAMP-binding protein
MLTTDGRRVIRGFYVPGEIFGVESGLTRTCWAEAVCDTYLLRFDRYRLELLADTDRAVRHELLSWLLISSDRTAHRIALLGCGNANEKLAYFLIDMADRIANNTHLDLPMSRSDIGDYLGLSSETVSRTFTALRRQRLIAIEGRSIILQDVEALRALAGD